MQFRILGPLEVVDGERPVDLGRPKQRAVLAALLVHANRVVSLDRLIDELWGEQPPPQATGSLQAYISHLRRVLEPGRSPRQPATVLVTQPPGYLLRVDPADLDAARFEQGAAEGRRLLAEGRPAEARERLQEALGLWRGPALADVAFESFARVEADRLEELRLGATEDRLQAELELGLHAGAVAELEPLVAAHPLRERLWALLMVALYRGGRQVDALRAYQAARRTLVEELGIEPGPALRHLEADILAQAPSLDWRPPGGPEPSPAPHPPDRGDDLATPATAAPAEWPLVGRQVELRRLAASLADGAAGRGRAVLVQGEPGIGKTRLVEELTALARAQGFHTAWGAGYEGGGTPGFWPWVSVVRSLVAADPDGVRQAIGTGAADLAQVVAEVGEIVGPVEAPVPAEPEVARVRLFEALAGFLRRLAARKPLVVVLDDLQWADAGSLQLLSFLGGHLRDARLLVVLVYRPAEVGPHHPLAETLAVLARHQVVERIELGGLAEPEVGTLIAATIGTDAAPDVVAAVQARTAGNPFFVAELVRLLHVERALRPDAVARVVPAGVRDVVRRRLARLPEQTTALLSLAAVAGREFDLAVLEAAAQLEPEAALDAVEAALIAGLVVEDHHAVGRLRFSHDLVREAIVDELSALRRARLHARLGEAVATVFGDDDAHVVELANHLFHAAPLVSPGPVASAALRAAEVATGRLAYEQAEEQLRRALAETENLPAGPERDRGQLDVLLRLTSLLAMVQGFAAPPAGEALAHARTLCERLGEHRDLVPVLWRAAAFHNVRAETGVARELGRELLDLASSGSDPAELVAAHHVAGVTALQQGRFHDARAHLEQALAQEAGLHDPWLESWLPQHPFVACTTFLSQTLWLQGEHRRSRAMADEAVRFAAGLGHDFTTVHALLFDAWISAWAGDRDRARASSDEVVKLARSRRFSLYAAMGTVFRGWAELLSGDADAAVAQIGEGLADMEATGAWMLHTCFLAVMAEAHWRAGRPEEALATVGQALDLAARADEHFYEPELHRLRGELLLVLHPDRRGEAEAALLRALEAARAQGAGGLESRAAETLARFEATSAVPG